MNDEIPLSGPINVGANALAGLVLGSIGVLLHYLGIRFVAFLLYYCSLHSLFAIVGHCAYHVERGRQSPHGSGEPIIRAAWQQFFRFGVLTCIAALAFAYHFHWAFVFGIAIGVWQIAGAITDTRSYRRSVGIRD